jgi:precorrin-4 methylase
MLGTRKLIDRYLGPVFQSLKSMGTPADVDVAIMSAKHGLIRADTPIQNYNDKMSPKKADMFKQDAGQMDRIKNTLDGYDNVIVQGGKDYKDVIRAAAGDAKITEVPGGQRYWRSDESQ